MVKNDFSLEEYLKELEYLVNIDSGSKDAEGTEKIAGYFREKFLQIGWDVKTVHVDAAVGPCLEVTNKNSEEFDILLVGHMDTVFEHGTAGARPFSIKENRAYGPGAYDMKASLLSAYYAVKNLNAQGSLQSASICLAFNSDEELSSPYSRKWIESLAKKSRYALVLEPARADGSMVHTRRGVGRYTIEFTGKASHSGIAPEKGISAINELAHWVIALHQLTDYAKKTSLNVGIVQGGTTVNTVAEKAVAQADLRVSEMSEASKVEKTIQELLANPKTPGIKVEVKGGITRPPMNASAVALELCKEIDDIASRIGVAFEWIATGGASDANNISAMGVPTLDGFGPVGGLSHTPDEYVEIDSIAPRLLLLQETIAHIVRNKLSQ